MIERKTTRLKGYDYSFSGVYFVTICTKDKKCILGNIENAEVVLNDLGNVVSDMWNNIPNHFPFVSLDNMVVMPNHIHGLMVLTSNDGLKNAVENNYGTSRTLGSVIRGFKIGVTKWARENLNDANIWQRGYFDHIVRDEFGYEQIFNYIENNPIKWELDSLNPGNNGY